MYISCNSITGGVSHCFINQASFGRTPRGERLERVMKSPNYRNGEFKNQHETLLMTSDRGRFSGIWEFIFRKIDGLRPEQAVKAIKTDLRKIGRNEEILVWFGHSSYLIQTGGKRILVDPVFVWLLPYLLSTSHSKVRNFIHRMICRTLIIS